jgi:hypothetical protein
MTTQNFLLTLGVGSALIAFWIALRFPDYGPEGFREALLHVVAALAIGWVTPLMTGVLFARGFNWGMAAIFGVLLPVMIYTFLAGAWFLRLAQATIGQHKQQ